MQWNESTDHTNGSALEVIFGGINRARAPSAGVREAREFEAPESEKLGFRGLGHPDLSGLTRLVVIDLSLQFTRRLENLIRNFTGLRELVLHRVNVYEQGRVWCSAISSSLQSELSNFLLTSPFNPSLVKLRHMMRIGIQNNFMMKSKGVTMMALLAQATALALVEHPVKNSSYR
ncbi:GMP synthase [glutamine-hydrolyzing], partial [Striga asiatica]